jgi:hypothetical protein
MKRKEYKPAEGWKLLARAKVNFCGRRYEIERISKLDTEW